MCKFDLASGFFQLRVAEEERKFLTFWSYDDPDKRCNLFQFVALTQGFANSPAIFTNAVAKVFAPAHGKMPSGAGVLQYVDDLMIYARCPDDLVTALESVLACLDSAGMGIRPSKCVFGAKSIEFLGLTISGQELHIPADKIAAIDSMKAPTTKKQLQSLIGGLSYLSTFLRNFHSRAAPWFDKLKSLDRIAWTDEDEAIFRSFKDELKRNPALLLPDYSKPFIVATDASDVGLGLALSQLDAKSQERPVLFASRLLTPTERNYSTHDRELLGVTWGLSKLEHYLRMRPFVLITDHQALLNLQSGKVERLAGPRWLHFIRSFNFSIVHRAGALNVVPDMLSRLPVGTEEDAERERRLMSEHIDSFDLPESLDAALDDVDDAARMENERFAQECESIASVLRPRFDSAALTAALPQTSTNDDQFAAEEVTANPAPEILKAQRADAACTEVKRLKALGSSEQPAQPTLSLGDDDRAELNKLLKPFSLSRLSIDSAGVLVYSDDRSAASRAVVPRSLREEILRTHHNSLLAAHASVRDMLFRLNANFWWPDMRADTEQWVKSCEHCTRFRFAPHLAAPPGRIDGRYPFDIIAVDLMGPFHFRDGTHYCLSIVDVFSRYTRLIAMESITAKDYATALVFDWILLFGVPARILTDNGPQFASELHRSLCSVLKIELLHSTVYHPHAGQLRRRARPPRRQAAPTDHLQGELADVRPDASRRGVLHQQPRE